MHQKCYICTLDRKLIVNCRLHGTQDVNSPSHPDVTPLVLHLHGFLLPSPSSLLHFYSFPFFSPLLPFFFTSSLPHSLLGALTPLPLYSIKFSAIILSLSIPPSLSTTPSSLSLTLTVWDTTLDDCERLGNQILF